MKNADEKKPQQDLNEMPAPEKKKRVRKPKAPVNATVMGTANGVGS